LLRPLAHASPGLDPDLFDHLIGAGEQRRWHFKSERLGGSYVDDRNEESIGAVANHCRNDATKFGFVKWVI